MTTPSIPPDNRAAGQAGHIDDHNAISDVLTSLSEGASLMPGVRMTVSALAPASPGTNDIWFDTSGSSTVVLVWSGTAWK